MVGTLNKQSYERLLLKESLELCGMETYGLDSYFNKDGNIQIENNSSLNFIYNIIKTTDLHKVMYIYTAGEASAIILEDKERQLYILDRCNSAIDLLETELSIKYDEVLSYARYFLMYAKVWLVDNIPNLECDVCKRVGAKEYDFDDLIKIMQDDIAETQNKRLYRLISYIMMTYDEADKAKQIMSLVCSWYGRSQDITDQTFMEVSLSGFSNIDVDRLFDIHTCESYILLAHARLEMADEDVLVDTHKVLNNAIVSIDKWCVYSFMDLVNLIIVLKLIVVATDTHGHFVELFYKTLDTIKDPSASPFVEAARRSGIKHEEFCNMIQYFLDTMGILDEMPERGSIDDFVEEFMKYYDKIKDINEESLKDYLDGSDDNKTLREQIRQIIKSIDKEGEQNNDDEQH